MKIYLHVRSCAYVWVAPRACPRDNFPQSKSNKIRWVLWIVWKPRMTEMIFVNSNREVRTIVNLALLLYLIFIIRALRNSQSACCDKKTILKTKTVRVAERIANFLLEWIWNFVDQFSFFLHSIYSHRMHHILILFIFIQISYVCYMSVCLRV